MTSFRQINPYRAKLIDPFWILPNNYLVDGVANGITDGSGGVVLLCGCEGTDNQLLVDESRFATNSVILSTKGSLSTTAPLAGAKVFANHPTNNTGLQQGFADASHLIPAPSTNFGTAFTFEFFWRRASTVTPIRGDFGALRLNSTDSHQIRLQDPGGTGYLIMRDSSNAIFSSAVNELMDTNWHHFCMENKVPGSGNRTISFYIDGVLKTTAAVSVQTTAVASRVIVYTNQGNTPGQFYIDEIRYTKGAYRYGAPFTVPTTPFLRG